MHLVLHLLSAALLPKDFFSNQAFAPACVSNQAVGRQVHPAKACCEILWLSWSPTHCCELQNGGFCQSFTFLLRRHRIKFSETFWFLIQTFVGATYGKNIARIANAVHVTLWLSVTSSLRLRLRLRLHFCLRLRLGLKGSYYNCGALFVIEEHC